MTAPKLTYLICSAKIYTLYRLFIVQLCEEVFTPKMLLSISLSTLEWKGWVNIHETRPYNWAVVSELLRLNKKIEYI